MDEPQNIMEELLSQRSDFIFLGLTGRTGSGCTTTANILSSKSPGFPEIKDLSNDDAQFFKGMDTHRYEIVKKYADEKFPRFYAIKVSDFISASFMRTPEDDCVSFFVSILDIEKDKAENFFKEFNLSSWASSLKRYSEVIDYIFDQELNDIPCVDEAEFRALLLKYSSFSKKIKELIDQHFGVGSYVKLYQAAGNSIRRAGNISIGYDSKPFKIRFLHYLPEIINRVVKVLRRSHKKTNKSTCIVIDAIRNQYEAKYFQDRYASFYLVSVNAPNEDRTSYLRKVHKFTDDEIKRIDSKESGDLGKESVTKCGACGSKFKTDKDEVEKLFTQNVKACLEISDIHLFNPRKEPQNNNVLKAQLAWYISLMQHPGIVTPTSTERVMQIAYSAKLNSGCISRQVGAAVTNSDFSIKSIGWNDVADGQVPCNLRSLNGLKANFNPAIYSKYERTDEKFRTIALQKLSDFERSLAKSENALKGYNLSYCFKSIQNEVEGEKNQVHTRSLHAEENAFLQLAKSGSMGIEGGKLFTTASPCELCAKKAYQLGIKEIVYIDPYPGIARDHIIAIGDHPPKVTQFIGAVGNAYHRLYAPLMPYKDELQLLKG
ncbi:anti-phage dCTP deaminase [Shewanella halotolerans]|uniref:anti-phage dCTP deaminase n=1 Tax=Shewanella halotolerans TaxID=2864204 RepID=UPI001C65D9D8|nr:anti-phage dCTP deaminase [Shewanella halotolerans]QYJ88843.1 deoxycytidylate deaminase [Shewanella halotolerans]